MSTTKAHGAPPTLADIDALPAEHIGEIIDGVLYVRNRPGPAHQFTVTQLGGSIALAFGRRSGDGPGGWWILVDPAIALVDSPHVVPDVGGWRRDRLRGMPAGAISTVPDWVCEVLSPTTRRDDTLIKMPKYARVGVTYAWLVDVETRVVSAHQLLVGRDLPARWVTIGQYSEERDARIPPFEDVALDVVSWWMPTDDTAEVE